jgi:AraC-like DNA-binding protein
MSALSDLEGAAGRISSGDMLPIKIERLLKRKRKGRLSEDEAARLLGISRRTLVRRLSENGTSFRELLDAHLKARAKELLDAKQLSRGDMAEALGFEDPTSFSRACRRWFKNG